MQESAPRATHRAVHRSLCLRRGECTCRPVSVKFCTASDLQISRSPADAAASRDLDCTKRAGIADRLIEIALGRECITFHRAQELRLGALAAPTAALPLPVLEATESDGARRGDADGVRLKCRHRPGAVDSVMKYSHL